MTRVLIPALIVLIYCGIAGADIYRHVDENGVVYYTDMKLRKDAVRVVKSGIPASSVKTKAPEVSVKAQVNDSDLGAIVNDKAAKYDLDPSLVHAVIKAESNGNQYAISRKGAMGLMQLMPLTAHELQVSNPFDPEDNIEGGTKYLKYLIERFNGNLTLALAAYNAGPDRVEQKGSVPRISETKQYVKKVLALYNGSRKVTSASKPAVVRKTENIYRVITDDGTVLFTNSMPYNNHPGF